MVQGGQISWHFNVVWEISRFKLTAQFPTRNSGSSANFSHTSATHCGLWRGVPLKIQGLRENSHSEIYLREFDLAQNPPPSPPWLEALVRKIILQMHTPSANPPHELGVCIWMHLVNGTGTGNSPGTADPPE